MPFVCSNTSPESGNPHAAPDDASGPDILYSSIQLLVVVVLVVEVVVVGSGAGVVVVVVLVVVVGSGAGVVVVVVLVVDVVLVVLVVVVDVLVVDVVVVAHDGGEGMESGHEGAPDIHPVPISRQTLAYVGDTVGSKLGHSIVLTGQFAVV